MANQLTVRNDAAGGATLYGRVLALLAVAGSQFVAMVAAAEQSPVGGGESITNPIFYPEVVGAFVVGVVVGVVGYKLVSGRKKKKDDE